MNEIAVEMEHIDGRSKPLRRCVIVVGTALLLSLVASEASAFGGVFVGEDGATTPMEYVKVAVLKNEDGITYLLQPGYEGEEAWTGMVVGVDEEQGLESVGLTGYRVAPFLGLDNATKPQRVIQAKGRKCGPPLPSDIYCCDEESPFVRDENPSSKKGSGAEEREEPRKEEVALVACAESRDWFKKRGWRAGQEVEKACEETGQALVALVRIRALTRGSRPQAVRLKSRGNRARLPASGSGGDVQALVWMLGTEKRWRAEGRPNVYAGEFVEGAEQRGMSWPRVYGSLVKGVWERRPKAAILEGFGQNTFDESVWGAFGVEADDERAVSVTRMRLELSKDEDTVLSPASDTPQKTAPVKEGYRTESYARDDIPPSRCRSVDKKGWVEGYREGASEHEIWRALSEATGVQTDSWQVIGEQTLEGKTDSKPAGPQDKAEATKERGSKNTAAPGGSEQSKGCHSSGPNRPGHGAILVLMLAGLVGRRLSVRARDTQEDDAQGNSDLATVEQLDSDDQRTHESMYDNSCH